MLLRSRSGAHPGTHEIGFDSGADTISPSGTPATEPRGICAGSTCALLRWLKGKTGVFDFRDAIVNELE